MLSSDLREGETSYFVPIPTSADGRAAISTYADSDPTPSSKPPLDSLTSFSHVLVPFAPDRPDPTLFRRTSFSRHRLRPGTKRPTHQFRIDLYPHDLNHCHPSLGGGGKSEGRMVFP